MDQREVAADTGLCLDMDDLLFYVQHPARSRLAQSRLVGVLHHRRHHAFRPALGFGVAHLGGGRDKTRAAMPNPLIVAHALFVWPIMLPEAIEYFLAEVGVLKSRAAADGSGR
jgi:hypothetical protein